MRAAGALPLAPGGDLPIGQPHIRLRDLVHGAGTGEGLLRDPEKMAGIPAISGGWFARGSGEWIRAGPARKPAVALVVGQQQGGTEMDWEARSLRLRAVFFERAQNLRFCAVSPPPAAPTPPM